MTIGITDHAQVRAMERYGFTLTPLEVQDALEQCRTGKAPCLKKTEAGKVHVVKLRDRLVITMIATKAHFIVTILPRDYFTAGSTLAHKQGGQEFKQRSRAPSNAMARKARRQSNRAIIQAAIAGDDK